MKHFTRTVLTAATTLGSAMAAVATASPVNGRFVNDARGDQVSNLTLPREIGDSTLFAAADSIVYHDHRYHAAIGVPDDGIANDWILHLTNVSGQSWTDLFFVADRGATIGNADGRVEDVAAAPGVFADAFRIDALGTNANLIHESTSANGILEPGEEWEFVVTNFGTGVNSLAPMLISPGVFAGSSPMVNYPGQTNASILGVPVPEPTTVGVLTVAAGALLMRRRRRRHAARDLQFSPGPARR